MKMRFGNEPRILIQVAIMGLALALFTVVAALFGCYFIDKKPPVNPHGFLYFLFIPVIMVLAVLPTTMFSFHIERDSISLKLFERIGISTATVSDYQGLRPQIFFAGALHFTGGRKIKVVGMNPAELKRLTEYLSDSSSKREDADSEKCAEQDVPPKSDRAGG